MSTEQHIAHHIAQIEEQHIAQHIAQLEEMLEIYSVMRLTCAHGLIVALIRELEEIRDLSNDENTPYNYIK